MRGSVITAGSFFLSQGVRLAANLALTRLLFPEAFGMMALVSVVLIGLTMFSDAGIGPSISQHKRGDDPDFLNTAWTINVVRGALLWLMTCALAVPAAHLYNAPELMVLLPVSGLALLIAGFDPTRIDTAQRHLLLGRVMGLDLIAQIMGTGSMVLLAWALQSVWALVIGALIAAVAKLVLTTLFLPGAWNRFRWDREAGHDLIRFGRWIFLSTACSFLLSQGDKALLGIYLSLEQLGLYNIGYFLASFPMLLGQSVTGRILIPLYRDHHPDNSAQDARRIRKMRYLISGGIMAMLIVASLIGVPLIGVMYDHRYASAGAIVVAIACVQMPQVVGLTYDQAALAAGRSLPFFMLMALRAVTQTAAFLIGGALGGLEGALIAQGLAYYALHLAVCLLARSFRVWDPLHDLAFMTLAILATALAVWLNLDALQQI